MGMFDYLSCGYPLPEGPADGWQTKSAECPSLDLYEIRADGSLWREEYDIEDHSDPNAVGLDAFVGCMARVNKRWLPLAMTGEIVFYNFADQQSHTGWIEYSAYFVEGQLRELHQTSYRGA